MFVGCGVFLSFRGEVVRGKSKTLSFLISSMFASFILLINLSCSGYSSYIGGTASTGEPVIISDLASVTVTTQILTMNGTQKELSDTPLPINLKIQITFSKPVDATLAEGLFSLKNSSTNIAGARSWNDDFTVMTIKPYGYLAYGTTYTVSIAVGTTKEATSTQELEEISAPFEQTFKTMAIHDFNGDGRSDLLASASGWKKGSDDSVNGNTGRDYLFYADNLTGNINASSASAIITGEQSDDYMALNTHWSSLDVNDDGYADIMAYSMNRAANYIFFGSTGTSVTGSLAATNANIIFSATKNLDELSIDAIGDVNGDGFSDLVASSSQALNGKGAVHIFLGPIDQSKTDLDANASFTGSTQLDYLGTSGTSVGDVNGDHIDDLVINAPGYNHSQGRIYVFFGGVGITEKTLNTADVVFTGDSQNSGMLGGTTVISDINGDGIKDIITSDTKCDTDKGKVYIFYSSENLSSKKMKDADVILTGENSGDYFGSPILVGDITGTGSKSLIISARNYGTNTGRVYLFSLAALTSKSASKADIIYTGENQNDYAAAVAIGDVNGDKINDLVLSSKNYPANQKTGRIYIFYGGANLTSSLIAKANIIITGEQQNSYLSFKDLYDFNGDGIMDVFAGAYGYNNNTGRGYVFNRLFLKLSG